MQLNFTGDIGEIEAGLGAVSPIFGIEVAPDGLRVEVVRTDDNRIDVSKRSDGATIRYRNRVQFFRALGLLVEGLAEGGDIDISETPRFDMVGPMIDVSQGNAVPTVETVKRLLRRMALMGLDMLMLYAEDSYVVPERPYFGYMRGRYSADETRAIDRYAQMLGIELIPCIQTLGHLFEVLKWNPFADLRDDDTTLLVGYEPTYQFIEEMIRAASSPVSTRRIHIGMDEAWQLGLGRYLATDGYRPKFEIMTEHLERVLAITQQLGLQPMMWSDMFFRALSPTNGYHDVTIPDELVRAIPQDVQLVYWDYYHDDEQHYVNRIRAHKQLGGTPIFAGGIWNWRPWALNYGYTFATTNSALAACKREGVREVIATLWGDDGTECDLEAAMLGLQLFAEHNYCEDPTNERIARRFRVCAGAEADDFWAIARVDETPAVPEGNPGLLNPSRYLLWQNVLMGLFDQNIRGYEFDDYYRELAERLDQAAKRNGEYAPMFELYETLCSVLAGKSELGLRLTDAYHRGDSECMHQLMDHDMPEVARQVRRLREFHRQRWHQIYKPFGWEVLDGRYGLLLGGIDTAIWRVREFLQGRIDCIEELEAERLPYQGQEGLVTVNYAGRIQSASRLVWYEG
jgi:hexosaminidase